MKKSEFCQCIEAMRKYSAWEKALYRCDIDLAPTPITGVLDTLALCMCDFNPDWAYDEKEGLDWIVEWSFGESDGFYQKRHGVEFDLTDAGALYDFLVFMNEHGWWEENDVRTEF
jgi:hypothetical protein